MGQYYTIAIRKQGNEQMDFIKPNGVKMMEHAWLGTETSEQVFSTLLNNPAQLAWVGDYAVNTMKDGKKQVSRPELFEGREQNAEFVLDAHFYYWQTPYELRYKLENIKPLEVEDSELVIINHTRREYLHLGRHKQLFTIAGQYGGCINPLAFLCDASQEFAGGDYCGVNLFMSGRWAGDLIEVKLASDFLAENEAKKMALYDVRKTMYAEIIVPLTDSYLTAEKVQFCYPVL